MTSQVKPEVASMAKPGSASNVFSHWHHPIENFQTSTLDFYVEVELALRPHRVPDLELSRVDWKEGGLVSARREYLRVQRGRLVFDICAAPFGADFFFSWWLAEVPPAHGIWVAIVIVIGLLWIIGGIVQSFNFLPALFIVAVVLPAGLIGLGSAIHQGIFGSEEAILDIPFFGPLYERVFKPVTYYKMDTTLMFQSVVHKVVTDVVDQVTTAKGIRALTELERKPIMREFYQR
jgi:hypothetical protein